MERFKYIDKLYIEENNIHINFKESNEKFIILKMEQGNKIPLENNIINLENLVEKEQVLREKLFKLLPENGINDIHKIKNSNRITKTYIYKGIKKNLNNKKYMIDIYVDNNGFINIDFQPITEYNISAFINTIYIEDSNLKLEVKIEGNNLTEEDIKSSSILINGNGIIDKKYSALLTENDKEIQISIGLKELVQDIDNYLYASLMIKGQIIRLSTNENLYLQPIEVNNNNIVKNIVISSLYEERLLIIQINENVSIKPVLQEIKYEDNYLKIKGKVNSSLDIFNKKEFTTKLNLINKSENIVIENDIDIENDKFCYKISKSDLFNIKKASIDSWDMDINVLKNDEIIESKKISTFFEEFILLNEEIYENRDTAMLNVVNRKNNVRLSLKGEISISSIMTIITNKKYFKIKYRTKENIEDLLDSNEIITSIVFEGRELDPYKTEKRGKKTYTCYYKSSNPKSDVESMLKRGVDIIIKKEDKEYKTTISEINKHSIYNSFWQVVQSSKKYKKICSKAYKKMFLKMPIKKNRVLFESFLGRNISGNPKYIYNHFVENGLDKKYELVWILNDTNESIEGRSKTVKRKSLKYYYYMATSRYWVFNARQGDEIVKREGITYLQTWHGTPLKRLGADMFNATMAGVNDVEKYKQKFKKNSSRWDYLIAQNQYSADIFKRAFYFDNEMLTYGYPANDILYRANNTEDINKLKEKFKIPKDKKVILYCPTWREDKFFKKGHYKMSLELELDKMKKELGDEYIILLRLHYLITNSINIADYEGFAYDFSGAYDIQELYLVSDVQITDYSSTMFDYANLRRPEIFFAYDLENYRDSLRGFYFELEEDAPGPVVKTTEEVIYWLKNLDKISIEYKEKEEAFYNKFCNMDSSNASKRIVDKVFFNK